MTGKATAFDKQFQAMLDEYGKRYDIESLTNPNDMANLHTMIRNQLVIEELQKQMHTLAQADAVANAADIKKINDSIIGLSQTNMQYERTLGIDRKTRKAEQAETIVDYITRIKALAREFLDDRLTKVVCTKCNIMVGRISGVYETTQFSAAFQCPQCKKQITVSRKERDIFFDVRDADWRRKYPIEIIQPKRIKGSPDLPIIAGDLTIGDEYEDSDDGITTET